MSFLNNPENNAIKVTVLVIIIAIAGYFVYSAVHQNALEGQGRVASSISSLGGTGVAMSSGTGSTGSLATAAGTTGKGATTGTSVTASGTSGSGAGTTGTATTGTQGTGTVGRGTTTKGTTGSDVPCQSGGTVLLAAAAGAPASPTTIVTATGGVTNGDWANITVTNPSACPVQLSKVQFYLHTNDTASWPPIQNIHLMDTTTGLQFGPALHPETSGGIPSLLPMTFAISPLMAAMPVTIAPGATHAFSVISDSRNVQQWADAAGTDHVSFKLQLWELYSKNTASGIPSDQTFSAPSTTGGMGTIPSIISALVTVM